MASIVEPDSKVILELFNQFDIPHSGGNISVQAYYFTHIFMAFDGFPSSYSSDARPFHERPVVLEKLPKFKGIDDRNFGDDGKYREVRIKDNGEELVNMSGEMQCRTPYDNGGVRLVDGTFDPSLLLPGGTIDGGVYGRRSMLTGLQRANSLLKEQYPGSELVLVDGFRSVKRQALGFAMILNQVLKGDMNPSISNLYELGLKADGVFSSVRADREHPMAREFMDDMSTSREIQGIAKAVGKSVEDVVLELLDMAANVRYAEKSKAFPSTPTTPLNMDVPLNFSNNAHAGGGAVDAFLFMNGRLANAQIPYDYVGVKGINFGDIGVQGAMDYMENPANYDEYRGQVRVNVQLQDHLRRQLEVGNDVTVDQLVGMITWDLWTTWRDYQRIFFHTAVAVGATMFSDTEANRVDNWGGEDWHIELPPLDKNGRPLPGGNPGRSLQTMGIKDAVATWGGVGAHEQLRKKGLLEY